LSTSDALGYAAPVAGEYKSVLDALAGQVPSVERLIADTGTVLSALGTREGQIESFVRAGDAALTTTARSERGLGATIAALPPFLAQLRASSTVAAAASGELGAATASLAAATPQLVPALQAIDGATPVFTRLFNHLPGVLAAGETGLPKLDAILNAARPALPQAFPAARQLIPVLQLLSVDRNSVVGALANAAQINNGVLDAPGLGAVHYASGAVTVWNETVGGWLHKLPTNRSNPYPAPDSELNIAHGGLRAYDCRNTGNPLYLPPTGAGGPPCLLQGPWTFNGKTAYYPRLQQAPP
jgi:phospholipid/cholesterol/gamma-HCH transport system substrate-binding protein